MLSSKVTLHSIYIFDHIYKNIHEYGGAPNKPLKNTALKHSILILSHVFKKQKKMIFL